MRIKCLRIFPEMCASTWCWLSSNSTRNIAFGKVSSTFAITSIASSFAISSQIEIFALADKLRRIACPSVVCQAEQRLSVTGGRIRARTLSHCNPCKDFRPFLGDSNGVLNVRTWLAIHGDNGPAVRQNLSKMRTFVYHRFHSEDISDLNFRSQTRLPVIWDLRIFVHPSADTMAYSFSDTRIPV